MSARYGVFLLASCNRLFGLGDVGEREANVRKFDAPVDAAPQCPPLGMAPTFRPAAHSLPFASCSNYPISESHMSTDGDVLARAAHYSGQPSTFGVELQHRDAPFRWSNAGTLPYQIDEETPPIVSNLTAGPEPHILWIEITTTGNNLREFAKRGGSWQQVDIYDFTTVAGYLANPVLTPDGLRMVFDSSNGIGYTDRPTIADRFRPAQMIANLPNIIAPVMTEDCGKLYFTALGTVLYFEQ